MRMHRTALSALLSILVLALAGCVSRTVVHHVKSNPKPLKHPEGIYYSLPKTVVSVRLPLEQTTTTRGTFADLVPCFFPEESTVQCGDKLFLTATPDAMPNNSPALVRLDAEIWYVDRDRQDKVRSVKWEVAPPSAREFLKDTTSGAPFRFSAQFDAAAYKAKSKKDDLRLSFRVSVDSGRLAATQSVDIGRPAKDPAFSNKSFALKDAILATAGVPDPEHVYIIDVKGGLWEDKMIGLTMSEDGIPNKIEVATTNYAGDVMTEVISSAAAIAGTAMSGVVPGSMSEDAKKSAPANDVRLAELREDAQCSESDLPLSENDLKVFLFLSGKKASGSEALTEKDFYCALRGSERKAFRDMDQIRRDGFRRFVGDPGEERVKTDQYLRAWYVFEQIKGIEDRLRNPFSSGSSDAIVAILADLRSQLKALRELFFGTQKSKPAWLASFELIPANARPATEDLFTYDKVQGLCWVADDLVKSVKPGLAADCAEPLTVSLEVTPDTNLTTAKVIAQAKALAEEPSADRKGRHGMYYRIPGPAGASLVEQKGTHSTKTGVAKTIATADLRVAQYGVVASLPHTTGGRKTQYTLEFFSATGAVQNFQVNSERALQEGQVASVGESVNAVLTDVQERRGRKREEREAAAASDQPPTAAETLTEERIQACREILEAIRSGSRPATDYGICEGL